MLACSVVKRLHEIQNVAILHIEKASEARLGLGLGWGTGFSIFTTSTSARSLIF